MASTAELQRAIEAARAGHKLEARELLLKIVDKDPKSETAWVLLAGLMDSLDDRIIACENALTINPNNEKVHTYLRNLQKRRESAKKHTDLNEATELLQKAREAAKSGDPLRALRLAEQATQTQADNEDAWLLIAELSPAAIQKIEALDRAFALNPSNQNTKYRLAQAKQLRDDPLKVAAHLEQTGHFDEALKVYNEVASRAKDSKEFDRIYKHIIRIEGLQNEKIQYVAPRTSIIRLSFGWPLLYFFLVLVQVGLKPFAHPKLLLWLCLPLVAVGGFLLSISEIRSKHIFWQTLFSEEGEGSSFARLVTATAGWILVIFPHLLLLIDSFNRLRNFRIPPEPPF